jgi:hypothetical protein
MIAINAQDFANLQPATRAQYRAAANFLLRAENVSDLLEKKELLNNALYHLREVNDTERIKLLESAVASLES